MTPEQEVLEDALIALRQRRASFANELRYHADFFPLHEGIEPEANYDLSTNIAAFAKRYEMTQDMLVRCGFRSIVAVSGKIVRTKALGDLFAEVLALGLIEDVHRWNEITKIRNELAHDYALTKSELVKLINRAWALAPDLLAMIEKIDRYVTDNRLLGEKDHG